MQTCQAGICGTREAAACAACGNQRLAAEGLFISAKSCTVLDHLKSEQRICVCLDCTRSPTDSLRCYLPFSWKAMRVPICRNQTALLHAATVF